MKNIAAEWLPKVVFDKWGMLGMRYINPKLVLVVDALWDIFGKPAILNTAVHGGNFDARVLRVQGMSDWSLWSDHSYGNAGDTSFDGIDSLTVQRTITKDPSIALRLTNIGLTAIEDGTDGWTHFTVSNLVGWDGIPKINGIGLIPIPKK